MNAAAATLVACGPSDLPALAGLLTDARFGDELTSLAPPGELLADPHRDPAATRLAVADGEPVGFSLALAPPAADERFAMIRVGVLPAWRRRGIGSLLLTAVLDGYAARAGRGGPQDAYLSTWIPNVAGTAFALSRGFQHARYYWHMERPEAPVPGWEWPAGIEIRAYDGTESALRDWTDAYNASFAEHHLAVTSSIEDTRALTVQPSFRADGVLLAHRAGRCVGFCRNILQGDRGTIGVLGTVPEARGIGLGRALLRASMAWLVAQGARRIDLLVDGENEGALALYRSEAFETTRTRQVWRRRILA